MGEVLFVSGIDTDAGKTYATGFIARKMTAEGKSVATVKFIQTGCQGISEDIVEHRKIMGTELPEDKAGITSPIIFSYPASAQLAAKLDGKEIDLAKVDNALEKLSRDYDVVLVEGAGGLMVPITDDFFTIDYAKSRALPVILVTNSILGSINHTVLSLEALKNRNMKLHSVAYNKYFDKDKIISQDTYEFISRYIHKHFPGVPIIDIPVIE